jgi:ABC-type Fe3+ transport system substrate-binding protein
MPLGGLLVAALTLAACGGSSNETEGGAAERGTSFEEVLRLADEEGEVVVWAYSDDERAALQEGMNEFLGTSIEVKGRDLSAGDAATQLITESRAGKATVDYLQPSFDIALGIQDRDLLPEVYPWKEVFGEKFGEDDIAAAVDSVEADFLAGRALNHRDVIYSMVYRTDMMKADELPKTWEDLAKPEYAGNFALDVRGYPFNYLSLALGEEQTLDLVRDLKANDPLLQSGSSKVGAAVSAGEVPFAVGGLDVKAQLSGVPVEVHYVEPIPLNQLITLVPTTAPHPNAGMLFAAYMATKGFELLEAEKLDYAARASDTDLKYSKGVSEQLGEDPEFVRVQSAEDLELLERMTAEIGSILSGQS